MPIKAPAPCSDETGSIMPEYCVAGMSVRRAVPKIAAIWLFMKEDIRRPMDVAMMT